MADPHGSNHYPIINSLILNIHPNLNHSSSLCSNVTNSPSSFQFNFNKADWELFSKLINSSTSPYNDVICPLKAYNQLSQLILDSAAQSIQTKHQKTKKFPPWWDSSCTQALNRHKKLFKIYRRTGSMQDFYNYNMNCASTTRLLKNKKRDVWRQFCSNLNPSTSIHLLWKTSKSFQKCILPRIHPCNND